MAIIWLAEAELLAVFREEIGEAVVVSPSGLSAALAAPQNAHAYGGVEDLRALAVAYAKAVAKGHALADGNKRLGLSACLAFLRINGVVVAPGAERFAQAMVALAAGRMETEEFIGVLFPDAEGLR